NAARYVGPRRDHHIGKIVAIRIGRRHADAAAIAVRTADEEVRNRVVHGDQGTAGDERLAADGEHFGAAAGAGAEDEVAEAVAVHVANGDISAIAESVAEGKEVPDQPVGRIEPVGGECLRAVDDDDARAAAEAGRDGQIRHAVSVDVADGGTGPAAEVR